MHGIVFHSDNGRTDGVALVHSDVTDLLFLDFDQLRSLIQTGFNADRRPTNRDAAPAMANTGSLNAGA